MIRVMLADDNESLRRAICDLLKMTDEILIVGEVSNGLEAVEVAPCLMPDILLTDMKMPHLSGLAVARWLAAEAPTVRILIISGTRTLNYLADDIPNNIWGFCDKMQLASHLQEAIMQIHAGQRYFPEARDN